MILVVVDIFGSATLIESIITEDIAKMYKSMIDRSCGRHIVACRKFGDFLCGIAKDTSLHEQRLFLLSSSSHVMSVRLLHKKSSKNLRSKYVVWLFDPNLMHLIKLGLNNLSTELFLT
ncbi:ShET2/EspL2 family type III secretion system effector toxin [Candidatus Ichthyocystis sparus]|uniref:ShET2/EspL2 family type III secretion system effector toxin n=2 Tax=Candidatus Ichthyocystis sparus TaxID=1561004 RepID=UPI000B81ACBF|nr:ShET2/EspL2 family type III secretion system effector toxin [Candidatus Ichthyocystis sparus]